ncbi:hypothetical protein EYF80_058494 [Liparis tanakae]|uniref:Uncharacterized protein n=1 Tax=Liparis tanakae TaxID=230148 RepID=A0A4Z2ESL6_9TELE|nr:hypothetical protein EYF80_058494 [Liparis tanakae]
MEAPQLTAPHLRTVVGGVGMESELGSGVAPLSGGYGFFCSASLCVAPRLPPARVNKKTGETQIHVVGKNTLNHRMAEEGCKTSRMAGQNRRRRGGEEKEGKMRMRRRGDKEEGEKRRRIRGGEEEQRRRGEEEKKKRRRGRRGGGPNAKGNKGSEHEAKEVKHNLKIKAAGNLRGIGAVQRRVAPGRVGGAARRVLLRPV